MPSGLDRALTVLWWIGLALVIASWLRMVPPGIGTIGFILTLIGFIGSLVLRRRR